MIIAIQGSKNFNDYSIFLRAMGTALSTMEDGDSELTVFSAGPGQINSFGQEFINVSNWKSRGIKAKLVKVPPSFLKDNIHIINYLAYFGKPKEALPEIVDLADSKNIEVGVYRY